MISKATFLSALEEVDNAILAALPDPKDCSFQFSKRFEQKMRSVIRRGNHPVIYTTLRRVACILLVLAMLFSGIMIVNTEVRASVIGWIKEQYETFYHYFFPAETAATEQLEYTLGWVPNNYTLVNTQKTDLRSTAIYFDPDGKLIQFSYIYGATNTGDFLKNENHTCHPVSINGMTGEVYISDNPVNANGIVWIDSNNNVLLSISAPLNEADLIKLAENVHISKKMS